MKNHMSRSTHEAIARKQQITQQHPALSWKIYSEILPYSEGADGANLHRHL